MLGRLVKTSEEKHRLEEVGRRRAAFGLGPAGPGSSTDGLHDPLSVALGGAECLERVLQFRRSTPKVIESAEAGVRSALGTLPGDAWTCTRHCRERLLPACGSFVTLKRAVVLVSTALDEGRTRGAESQHASLAHAYEVQESVATDPGHALSWGWPLLGVPDLGGAPR